MPDDASPAPRIRPVVLCGGPGVGTVPSSVVAGARPGPPTLLRDTLERVDHEAFARPTLMCGAAHADVLGAPGRPVDLVVEPTPRSTGPAVAALAAHVVEGLVLVLPADHEVAAPAALRDAILAGAPAARDGAIVTFGVRPEYPATGYGWIERGPPTGWGAHAVAGFEEKPHRDRAAAWMAAGRHLWNSGIYLFEARQLLQRMRGLGLSWVDHAIAAVAHGRKRAGRVDLDAAAFMQCPPVSFDVAVMERSPEAVVVPVEMGWGDVGGAPGGDRAGEVVPLGGAAAPASPWSQRPWGHFVCLDRGAGYQVKRLQVEPGRRLSRQRHRHRHERWTVVHGTARVELDGVERRLGVGDVVDIRPGAVHRLANPGEDPLVIIEVQTGAYLGEDDIERFADDFGRV